MQGAFLLHDYASSPSPLFCCPVAFHFAMHNPQIKAEFVLTLDENWVIQDLALQKRVYR